MSVSSVVAGVSLAYPGVTLIRLRGLLGPAAGADLPAAVQSAGEETDARTVVLDFSAVEWLSGTVLIPMAVAQARMEKAGLRLGVAGLPRGAEAAFRAVWPARALLVYDTEADALAALKTPDPTAQGLPARDIGAGQDERAGGFDVWAQDFSRLHVTVTDPRVPRINVEGQTICGPAEGFGQMWHKLYRVRLQGAAPSPEEVVSVWKDRFTEFWPPGNRLYTGPEGLSPGAVGVITLAGPLGVNLITGVQVVYSGPDAFVFVPVRGHMFCGLIAFSAYRDDGATVAQVQAVVRPSDPLWEAVMQAGGYRQEDSHWFHTLKMLSQHFGAQAWPELSAEVVGPDRRWGNAGNLLFNSGIWSGLYLVTSPLRRGQRP